MEPNAALIESRQRKPSPKWLYLPTLFFYVSVYMVLLGAVFYVKERTCVSMHNATACAGTLPEMEAREVSSVVGRFMVGVGIAFNLPALFLTSLISNSSDRVGRLPVMLLSTMCFLLFGLISAVVVWFGLPLHVLYLGCAAAGFGGHIGTFNAAAFCYVVDVQQPTSMPLERNYALLQVFIMAGGAIGPLLGGYLFHADPVAPFVTAVLLDLICIILLLGCVKESVANASLRNGLRGGGGGFLSRCRTSFDVLRPSNRRHLPHTSPVWMWCLSFLIFFVVLTEANALLQLYLPLTLHWAAGQTGLLISVVNVSKLLTLFVLLPLLTKWAPEKNARSLSLIRLSALICVTAWSLFTLPIGDSFGVGPRLTYAVGVLEGMDMMALPLVRAQLARMADSQGAVQGLLANLEVGAMLLDPLIFGSIYAATVRWLPPFALLVLIALALANLLLTLCLRLPPAGTAGALPPEVSAPLDESAPAINDDRAAAAAMAAPEGAPGRSRPVTSGAAESVDSFKEAD